MVGKVRNVHEAVYKFGKKTADFSLLYNFEILLQFATELYGSIFSCKSRASISLPTSNLFYFELAMPNLNLYMIVQSHQTLHLGNYPELQINH